MNMNLVAIAGVPPAADMSGKLIGVGVGDCGCQGFGADLPPTVEQKTAFNWAAVGFFGLAVFLGYWWGAEPKLGGRPRTHR